MNTICVELDQSKILVSQLGQTEKEMELKEEKQNKKGRKWKIRCGKKKNGRKKKNWKQKRIRKEIKKIGKKN